MDQEPWGRGRRQHGAHAALQRRGTVVRRNQDVESQSRVHAEVICNASTVRLCRVWRLACKIAPCDEGNACGLPLLPEVGHRVVAFAGYRDAPVRRRVPPAVDLGARPAPSATVTGVVRLTEASRPASGRTVEIVNTSTGERRSVQTTDNGGFALAVPAGRYRLDVTLRDGETI